MMSRLPGGQLSCLLNYKEKKLITPAKRSPGKLFMSGTRIHRNINRYSGLCRITVQWIQPRFSYIFAASTTKKAWIPSGLQNIGRILFQHFCGARTMEILTETRFLSMREKIPSAFFTKDGKTAAWIIWDS